MASVGRIDQSGEVVEPGDGVNLVHIGSCVGEYIRTLVVAPDGGSHEGCQPVLDVVLGEAFLARSLGEPPGVVRMFTTDTPVSGSHHRPVLRAVTVVTWTETN